jgi:hypothetical protein
VRAFVATTTWAVSGTITAAAILLTAHLDNVFRPTRIVLQRRQDLSGWLR